MVEYVNYKAICCFWKNKEEVFNQLSAVSVEFDFAGWRISLDDKFPFNHFTAINSNIKIGVYSCVIGNGHGINWDNCWISNRVSGEEIESIIMPLSISNTPEIHFF